MTVQEIVIFDILGLVFTISVINLVRTRKLCVSFAIIWLLWVMALMLIVSVPYLLLLATKVVGTVFPVSILTFLVFVFIFFILFVFSLKLSSISDRQAELVQTIALEETYKQKDKVSEECCSKSSDVETQSKVE